MIYVPPQVKPADREEWIEGLFEWLEDQGISYEEWEAKRRAADNDFD